MAASTFDSEPTAKSSRSRWWIVHLVWASASTLLLIVVAMVAFVLGGILGQSQLYESWRVRKIDKLSSILNADEFSHVNVESSSAAQVYLSGTVSDGETLDSLELQLIDSFGRDEAEEMLWRIDITDSDDEIGTTDIQQTP